MTKGTVRALAKRLGVTVQAVYQAVDDGRIVPDADQRFDLEAAEAAFRASAHPTMGGKRKGAGRPKGPARSPTTPRQVIPNVGKAGGVAGRIDPGTNLREAMRVERVAKAERQQLEVARLRAELLPRDRVLRSVETWGKVWRDGLLALPVACAEELAAAFGVSAPTVIVELERVVRDFLESMSGHAFRLADDTDRAAGGAS